MRCISLDRLVSHSITVLHFTVLHCTTLHCTALHYIASNRTTCTSTVLYCTALLYCWVRYCITLHCILRISLYSTVLYCILLSCLFRWYPSCWVVSTLCYWTRVIAFYSKNQTPNGTQSLKMICFFLIAEFVDCFSFCFFPSIKQATNIVVVEYTALDVQFISI